MTPAFPPIGRRFPAVRIVAIASLSLLAVALLCPAASAAPPKGGKSVWLQGYVESTSGSAIRLKGTWYELAQAQIVDARSRPLSSGDIKKNAYFYMRLDNGTVRFMRVYQDIGR